MFLQISGSEKAQLQNSMLHRCSLHSSVSQKQYSSLISCLTLPEMWRQPRNPNSFPVLSAQPLTSTKLPLPSLPREIKQFLVPALHSWGFCSTPGLQTPSSPQVVHLKAWPFRKKNKDCYPEKLRKCNLQKAKRLTITKSWTFIITMIFINWKSLPLKILPLSSKSRPQFEFW